MNIYEVLLALAVLGSLAVVVGVIIDVRRNS